jgi:hypothetical protein
VNGRQPISRMSRRCRAISARLAVSRRRRISRNPAQPRGKNQPSRHSTTACSHGLVRQHATIASSSSAAPIRLSRTCRAVKG